jgi:hypothetical protein
MEEPTLKFQSALQIWNAQLRLSGIIFLITMSLVKLLITEGSRNVSYYRTTICMLSTPPKRERGTAEDGNGALEMSQTDGQE